MDGTWCISKAVEFDVSGYGPANLGGPGVEGIIGALKAAKPGRIDLLACDLAETKGGVDFVNALEKETGINVAASTDATGNVKNGGDWILETDDVDALDIYFDADKIKAFDGVLRRGGGRRRAPSRRVVHTSRRGPRRGRHRGGVMICAVM